MAAIKLSSIAAMAENRVIGKDNALIWHLPADLKHFKALTMDKPLVMGRKCFESLPGVLPGRPHIVVTRQKKQISDNPAVHTVATIEEALDLAKTMTDEEIFIAGGGQIYEQTLNIVERIYLTILHRDYDGDAYFPKLNWDEWETVDTEEFEANEEKDRPAFTILTLNKISS